MRIAVLGASGGTGRQLVAHALAGGHQVRALVRNPDSAGFTPHPRLEVVRADVNDAASIAVPAAGGAVVHSGPLSDKADDARTTLAPLAAVRRRLFPHGASRTSVARLMIELATRPPADPAGVFLIQTRSS